jgi:hypothetical protein
LQQLAAGCHTAIDAFVGDLLRQNEGLMEPQESSSYIEESRPERAGLLGSGFVRYRRHEIILAGYFKNGGRRILFFEGRSPS